MFKHLLAHISTQKYTKEDISSNKKDIDNNLFQSYNEELFISKLKTLKSSLKVI
jgi:hypothetical protein